MTENYKLEEKLTTKNMRKLSKYIIEKESLNDELEIKVAPLTIIEWYKTNASTKEFKLQKYVENFTTLIDAFNILGETNPDEKKIYLLFDNFKILKLANPKHIIIDFIQVTYHELAHAYQTQHLFKYNNLEVFSMAFLSNFIIKNDSLHYNIHYQQYFEEIDANLYAINKTITFLENYPKIYQKHKNYINKLKTTYEYRYANYNFQLFFDKFHNIYKQKPEEYQDEHIITKVFYKENTSDFKSITEIINNKDFNFFSPELFYSIITSKSFLEQIDFYNLNEIETLILRDAIKYSINLEIEKEKRNESLYKITKDISEKIYLLYERKIITNKIDYLLNKKELLNENIIRTKQSITKSK